MNLHQLRCAGILCCATNCISHVCMRNDVNTLKWQQQDLLPIYMAWLVSSSVKQGISSYGDEGTDGSLPCPSLRSCFTVCLQMLTLTAAKGTLYCHVEYYECQYNQ